MSRSIRAQARTEHRFGPVRRFRELAIFQDGVHHIETDQGTSPNEFSSARVSQDTDHRTDHSVIRGHSLNGIIQYLDDIRHSLSRAEAIASAIRLGLILPSDVSRDLIVETSSIPSVVPCSLLMPGATFSGTQTTKSAKYLNGSPYTETYWPIKVTIDHVDLMTMTLSGTMESRNIPDGITSAVHPRVITYLEGEIIDFKSYTLRTSDSISSHDLDAHYWNLMPPFRDLHSSAIANSLLCSRCEPSQDIAGYILMRWRERHLITPETLHEGLSIRGLYYVSFRRLDGEIRGAYYERGNYTTQEIRLKPDSPLMNFRPILFDSLANSRAGIQEGFLCDCIFCG